MSSLSDPAAANSKDKGKSLSWGKILSGKVLNLLLWWSFCALAGTGLLLAWRLPPGSRGGKGLSAMGLGRHDWGDIHAYIGYAFLALVVWHIVAHWRWLWQFASKKRPLSLFIGLGIGLALGLYLWLQPVAHRGGGGEKDRAEHSEKG